MDSRTREGKIFRDLDNEEKIIFLLEKINDRLSDDSAKNWQQARMIRLLTHIAKIQFLSFRLQNKTGACFTDEYIEVLQNELDRL